MKSGRFPNRSNERGDALVPLVDAVRDLRPPRVERRERPSDRARAFRLVGLAALPRRQ